jgi:hypothetical protein
MTKRRWRTEVICGIIVVLLGGAAFAFWTVGGSGTGTASTGAGSSVVVIQTSSAAGLYPGGSAALSGNFNNPNAGPVTITSVTAAVHAFSTQPDNTKPACTQADFSITGTSNNPGSIASGNGVGAWNGLTINMINAGTNQDNCKSLASIQIDYTAA